MRTVGWLSALIVAGLMTASEVRAEAHSTPEAAIEPSDQQTLTAIKEALVSEAQSVESQVINTAWLDAEGKLHESTMVQSGMRVRGIQVQAYLDEMQKPKVEVALDAKTGLLPQCFAKDDHLKRTVKVHPTILTGQFVVDSESIAIASGARMASRFRGFFERATHWHPTPVGMQLDDYTQTMTGARPTTSKFALHVTISEGVPPEDHQAEAVPGADPVSSFFNGSPSKFSEDWVRLQAELIETGAQDVTWTGVADFRIPVRDVTYKAADLPRTLAALIDQQVETWSQELAEYARCEPIRFQITEGAGTLEMDGGSNAGLRTGDQLLLIDASRIPSRVLEPGALADLSLVEVVAVDADQATLQYRAGAPISDATGKVALPF
jgi:hypothetical protein